MPENSIHASIYFNKDLNSNNANMCEVSEIEEKECRKRGQILLLFLEYLSQIQPFKALFSVDIAITVITSLCVCLCVCNQGGHTDNSARGGAAPGKSSVASVSVKISKQPFCVGRTFQNIPFPHTFA